MPESLWVCRVKEFGPLIVSIDTHGNNLIAENKKLFAERRDPHRGRDLRARPLHQITLPERLTPLLFRRHNTMKPSPEWWRYLAPLAVIAIIALLPVPAGLENHTWLYFCRFYWRDRWTDPRTRAGCRGGDGGYLHHRHTLSLAAVQPRTLAQPGFKFTAKSLSWAVSGFLIRLSGSFSLPLCLAQAMKNRAWTPHCADSGEKMGHRTLFLGYAVMFSELILAPVTPSNSARGAGIIYPIIRNLPPLYQSHQTTAVRAALARTSCGWGLLPTA